MVIRMVLRTSGYFENDQTFAFLIGVGVWSQGSEGLQVLEGSRFPTGSLAAEHGRLMTDFQRLRLGSLYGALKPVETMRICHVLPRGAMAAISFETCQHI